ncbi:hypothetical protein Q8A67_024913 [Cirrhinus molitorella]|uniref:Uncharacterized protein n=1 Tax=Cirrhinus molitorella TaxID=172907 RepID=A0AA88P595_9TELE|nr:hypothetical protein Q8A67_024913 [Cirrhinus molitorella]
MMDSWMNPNLMHDGKRRRRDSSTCTADSILKERQADEQRACQDDVCLFLRQSVAERTGKQQQHQSR